MNITSIANIKDPHQLADALIARELHVGPFQFNDDPLHQQINRLWSMTRACPSVAPKALLAKIGGQLPLDQLEGSTLKTFLLANHLHHRMQMTRMAVTSQGALPFVQADGTTRWIPWNEINEVEAHGHRSFSHQGTVLFTTDSHYKLSTDYTYTQDGIRRYNIWTADEPIPFMTDDPTKWDRKFVLEIRSDIHHSQGEYGAGGCSGQHTFLILRHPDGRSYAIGKYGPFDDIQCIDKISPGGKKPGRISFVDEYMAFPPGFANTHSAKIELSPQEYATIFDAIRRTHAQPHSFSLIKDNCNTFVVNFVKTHCNITIKNRMPLRVYFFRLFPRPIVEFVYKMKKMTYEKFPPFLKKGLSIICFPVRYLFNVATSAIGFLLSLFNREGLKGQDISILDVILGTGEVHHPTVFRDSLKKMADPNGFIPRTVT
ncbi:MAG: hypothetical protein KBC64_05755 [Simkaniaceae bacterium]|nr:hypothetical protein [Simkaniaceae bacterium]